MKLYSFHRNSAGERVRIALNLKGLSCTYVSAPALGAAYRRINPQGLMPALAVDGRVIAQSAAILEYLEETHPRPPLLPAAPARRAAARQFAQVIACEMHPVTVLRVRRLLAGELGADVAAVQAWCRRWMAEGLATLETMLARQPAPSLYCFGDAPGWADLHLVPQLRNARRFGCDLAAYPRLLSIETRCVRLDAFRLARPESQPDFPDNPAVPPSPL